MPSAILIVLLAAGAAIVPAATAGVPALVPSGPVPVTVNGCPIDREWTDEILVGVLGQSSDKVRKLHEVRGLTAYEVCTMPPEKLARAIVKVDEPKPDMPGEAARFREMQQAGDDGTVRPDGLVNAFSERLSLLVPRGGSMPQLAGISSSSWTALGPGNIGGRLRSVLTHPTDPNLLFVGSVAGGIWKSTDGGTSWAPVNDFMPNVAISSLVRDPGNSQRIYAGTGEGFYNGDSIRGFGVFVSTDGGATFTQMGGTVPDVTSPPATQQSDFLYVNRIAVHPTNPDIVLVATTGYYCNWGGVYRTTNATSANPTWTRVYSNRTLDVRFDPNNGNNVILGEGSFCSWNGSQWVSDGGAVAWSANAGASFTRVALDTTTKGRVEVAWAKATPGLAVAVTEGNGGSGGDGRFWVSTTSGQAWSLNSQPGHLSGQGWYNNALWIDPMDSTRVVVGGLDVYRGSGAANWWSANAAVSWTKISQWFTSTSVHADNHAIVAASGYNGSGNRVVYIGNDGGLYKSADIASHDGANFSANWVNLNNGLQVTQFYGGAGRSGYPGGVTRVVGGTQDNGSLKAPASGTAWSAYFGGDGGFAAVDPADPNYYYGEYVYAAIHRATTGGSSSYICSGIAEAGSSCGGNSSANFISPFVLDPNNANTMLAGARSLWRSANVKSATPTWSAIKAPDTYSSTNFISAIAIAPGSSDVVWVGHNHGEVYCSTNGTAATPLWTKVTALTATRMVLRITIDPANVNRIFVTYGGYNGGNVQEVTDATQACKASPTVTGRHGNLPQAPVRTLVRHPTNASWLYVGTDVGIFTTTDGGASWSTTNDGPGTVAVDELFWLDTTTLAAATHGRGMFTATVGGGGPVATATTLATSQNPSVAGQSVTFTAAVTGGNSPTGTVNFKDGSNSIAGCSAVALTSGQAQCATSALTVGTHGVTAVYGGDANNLTSTSSAISQVVKTATTTSVTSSQNPANAGTAITFTATITGGSSPTGSVAFKDGASTITNCSGQAIVTGKTGTTATCQISALAAGGHSITAVYSGDASNGGSTSPVLTQTINGAGPVPTTTAVIGSPNPSVVNQSVTFTATVSGGSSPTGTINFKDGANSISGCSAQPVAAAQAQCTTSALTQGSHTITAVYSGDAGNQGSTSPNYTQTVNASGPASTTTTLGSAPNPSTSGQSVTFTATITGGVSPTGTINFKDGANSISGCAAQPVSAAQATCITSALGVGAHSITAVYSGDANNSGSTSNTVSQQVNSGSGAVTSTSLISSLNPSNFGQSVTFLAVISGGVTPTGTMNFKDGANSIAGCSAQPVGPVKGGYGAICVTSSLSGGSHSITAVYSGDGANQGSTSPPLTQTVNGGGGGPVPTTTTVTSSSTYATAGTPVTFTATITGNGPTGSVNFKDGASSIGGCSAQPVSNSKATCTTSSLAIGKHSITAAYGGDANNLPSTSAAIGQVIQ